MNSQHYMCSHLVQLRTGSQVRIVNLEEIWETGAILEAEEPVKSGIRAEIRAENTFFAGDVAEVEQHELGWRLRMEFSPMTRWRPELFRPDHLLKVK